MAAKKAIVTIKGKISDVEIFQPQGDQQGKAHLVIDILQKVNGMGSNIVTIKDDDLTAIYHEDSMVEIDCVENIYYFNNKPGVSHKVFRGGFKEDPADIPLGKTKS